MAVEAERAEGEPSHPSSPCQSRPRPQRHWSVAGCAAASQWQTKSPVWAGTSPPVAERDFRGAWVGVWSQGQGSVQILACVPVGCRGPDPGQRLSHPGGTQLCSASSGAPEEPGSTPQPRSYLYPEVYLGPSAPTGGGRRDREIVCESVRHPSQEH